MDGAEGTVFRFGFAARNTLHFRTRIRLFALGQNSQIIESLLRVTLFVLFIGHALSGIRCFFSHVSILYAFMRWGSCASFAPPIHNKRVWLRRTDVTEIRRHGCLRSPICVYSA